MTERSKKGTRGQERQKDTKEKRERVGIERMRAAHCDAQRLRAVMYWLSYASGATRGQPREMITGAGDGRAGGFRADERKMRSIARRQGRGRVGGVRTPPI